MKRQQSLLWFPIVTMIKIDDIQLGEEEEKRAEISLDLQKIYE